MPDTSAVDVLSDKELDVIAMLMLSDDKHHLKDGQVFTRHGSFSRNK